VSSIPDAFFFAAGIGMLVHVVSSRWLLSRVGDREDLLRQMFKVPNGWLVGDDGGPSLLRVEFWVPWKRPASYSQLDPTDRAVFLLARLSGCMMVGCILGFFASIAWLV
jgi:hypothetical protein